MDRSAFDHLYLHGQAITELAFIRSMVRLMTAPPPELTDAQRDANAATAQQMLHLTEDQFDWSALEGVDGYGGAATPDVDEAAEALDPIAAPHFAEAVGDASGDEGALTEMPDVAEYLGRVQAARPALEPRMAALWARADLPTLQGLVAAAPTDLPALTAPLDAAALTAWIERHEAQDPAVMALVHGVRNLDP